MPSLQEHDAALRRIAVLLHALPEHTHAVLLDRLGTPTRRKIGEQMEALGDIDPMEQYRVLTQLKDHFDEDEDAYDQVESEIQDEISIGSSRYRKSRPTPFDAIRALESNAESDRSKDTTQSHSEPLFGFLDECDDAVLADLLRHEHPQTISVVLASIRPSQAAAVLTALPSDMQTETLTRIARLDDVDRETLKEVSDEIRHRLIPDAGPDYAVGRETLQAIIDAMPQDSKIRLAAMHAKVPSDSEFTPSLRLYPSPDDASNDSSASSDLTATDGNNAAKSDRHRESVEAMAEWSNVPPGTPASTTPSSTPSWHDIETLAIESVDRILMNLSSQDLCKALGLVASRNAFLTLCGLPNEASEQALALLPRRQAKKVRHGMRHLGDLQLREIDAAKREVLVVAIRAGCKFPAVESNVRAA